MMNAAGFLLVIAARRLEIADGGAAGRRRRQPGHAADQRVAHLQEDGHGQGVSIGMMDSFDSLGRIIGPLLAGSLYGRERGLSLHAVAAGVLVLCRF